MIAFLENNNQNIPCFVSETSIQSKTQPPPFLSRLFHPTNSENSNCKKCFLPLFVGFVGPHSMSQSSRPGGMRPCDRAQHCMAKVGLSRCLFSQMPRSTKKEDSSMPSKLLGDRHVKSCLFQKKRGTIKNRKQHEDTCKH